MSSRRSSQSNIARELVTIRNRAGLHSPPPSFVVFFLSHQTLWHLATSQNFHLDMPSNPLKRYQHGEGSYALVTGATMGMGEEWAHQLAALGFNLILHGRSQTKLDAVRALLLRTHPAIDIKTVIADAGTLPPDLGEFEALLPALSHSSSSSTPFPGEEPRITVLINNVGVTSKAFPLFEEAPTEDLLQQIAINDVFPTILTQRVLPTLKRNQPSLIVNVTSMGAWAPSPL